MSKADKNNLVSGLASFHENRISELYLWVWYREHEKNNTVYATVAFDDYAQTFVNGKTTCELPKDYFIYLQKNVAKTVEK